MTSHRCFYSGPFTAFVGMTILALDRFFKFLALSLCQEPHDFTSFFSCTLSFNRGASFGMFSTDNTWLSGLLFSCIIALIIFLRWSAYKRLQTSQSVIPETLIIAGALGNLLDRIIYRAVVDFISVHYGSWYFPTFNVADIAITCGVALFIYREWFNAQPK